MSVAVRLVIGAQFWMDGTAWTVQEFVDGVVVLVAGQNIKRVSVARLAADAQPLGADVDGERQLPVAAVLSSLSPDAMREAEAWAVHIRELASAATPGDRQSLFRSKSAELGVSVMTLRRWLTAYESAGVAGLVDARLRKSVRREVHPLWDEACLAELRRYTSRSTPTKGAIIAATALRLESEWPDPVNRSTANESRSFIDKYMWQRSAPVVDSRGLMPAVVVAVVFPGGNDHAGVGSVAAS